MDQSSDIASAVSPKKSHTFWVVLFFAVRRRKAVKKTCPLADNIDTI